MKAIDLFAGAGGTSLGATMAGLDVVFAANHNRIAVDTHELNFPKAQHECQDLHQIDWSILPDHDWVFASPCCQGHSNAAGKNKLSKKADISRSTAFAVVHCLDIHDSPVCIVENVPSFREWRLFDSWCHAVRSMGYAISENVLNAADFGVPQNRERLFMVLTKSRNPIQLEFEKVEHVPARSFVDLTMEGHVFDDVSTRVPATQSRVANSKSVFGEIHLDAAYGSANRGRSLDLPLGTVTCVNKHSLVIGDKIRPLTVGELAAAQSFPPDYKFPKKKTLAKQFIGNAVPPLMAKGVTEAVLRAV
ncbi:DNA cytosine methyltransferase [Photobacterium leiognathi]|uniref:DNA cytosine methyltransferase n=1 Tax=Photobacterium leiognathi TaxID=553611 RepID=UPI002982478B|nr:DNA cytosine methyltransferase [Photobacterium leiognathi]